MVHKQVHPAVRAGFTLMEMLVVVAILVVLAGVGGIYYMRYLDEAKQDAARIQVMNLTKAAETFRAASWNTDNAFPSSLEELARPQGGVAPYLELSALVDPWGRPYQYQYPGQHNTLKPDIWSDGPRPGDPASVIGNWSAMEGIGGR